MAGIRIEINGLNAVLKNLDLTNKVIHQKVKNEIQGAAMKTSDDVKRSPNFPHISGRLQASYTFFHPQRKSYKYSDDDGTSFTSELKGYNPQMNELSAAAGTNVEYGSFIEDGTQKSTGNFKLAHAFVKNQELLLQRLRDMFK
jgi:hypothetical protein